MRKIYKTLLASALLLMLHVSMVMGANITYSLTTHVDGRTITGSVNLAEGANLNDNMPQAFWRAYTTYKYYSDAALTQEITTATATVSTVYVDYVFEPPFTISVEGANWYYYLNAYVGNATKRYLKNDLSVGNSPSADNDRWAIYGDGYSMNFKNRGNKKWLSYNDALTGLQLDDNPRTIGWQMYESSYTRNGTLNGTVVIATHSNEDRILYVYDFTSRLQNKSGFDAHGIWWDERHKLAHDEGNANYGELANSSFFFTIGTNTNIYQVTWRMLQADGTWKSTQVQKDTSFPKAIYMPSGWERNGYTYDRYYKDAEFTEKYPDDYVIQRNDGTTIIYIKESYKFGEPFVTDHWITLALSYGVNNLANEFGYASDGVSPAVRVLEYTALTTNAENTKYTLTFTETNKIEAHKPYLFKADEVLEGKNLNLSKDPSWGNKPEADLISYVDGKKVAWKDQTNNSPYVTMIGTYLDKELTVQSQHPDLLYFYFGYDKRYDPASDDYVGETAAEGKQMYNFYRVTSKNVTIHPFHCYFMIEGASTGAKFMLMDNFGNEITSVEGIDADSFIQTTGRIYNLNGQMVGNDLEALPRGVYIVNGKKVMK